MPIQKKGEYGKAQLPILQEATHAMISKMPTPTLPEGYAYDKAGERSKAIDDYTEAIRLIPPHNARYWLLRHVDAFINRALAHQANGDYEKAVADFAEAIGLNAKDPEPYYGRASAYEKMGKYSKAIDDLTEAIRLEPKYGKAYSARGYVYLKIGDQRKAKADAAQVKKLGYVPKEPRD